MMKFDAVPSLESGSSGLKSFPFCLKTEQSHFSKNIKIFIFPFSSLQKIDKANRDFCGNDKQWD